MKQSPSLDIVQGRMRPGVITRDGFLGTDRRPLTEILDDDQNTLNRMGLTHAQVADRMDHLTEEGNSGLGTTVTVDGVHEVRVDAVRGYLPCPWGHKGLYPKVNVFVRNLSTGQEMMWTALTIHLIREHGFYEGRGGAFRIEPEQARAVLGL
jgi:hypothetical protein